MLDFPALKLQTTHIKPIRPPTIIKETKIIMIFWKRVNSIDQKIVCNNIKIAQLIPARIDITTGIKGFGSFFLMATILSSKYIVVWITFAEP
ncbi:MAG: hypothetical protein L6N94_04100 [Candidatus Methylarchaceae archaeon HK01M]|nr:hypothetical protein [Candidatus Methylarchaceae archaeon HK01M]